MTITTLKEGRRGCGYRKAGGMYLRTDALGRECGMLPIELSVCPTCHHGIKPARGWTWVNLAALASAGVCRLKSCGNCPLADSKIQEVGLIWIGEKYYATPREFAQEAHSMGLSRRITQVPKRFKLGETWVALAHRKAIEVAKEFALSNDPVQYKAGIFHVFKPQRIEYVVSDYDSDEKLEKLEKKGITLVKVIEDHSDTTTKKAA